MTPDSFKTHLAECQFKDWSIHSSTSKEVVAMKTVCAKLDSATIFIEIDIVNGKLTDGIEIRNDFYGSITNPRFAYRLAQVLEEADKIADKIVDSLEQKS